MLESHLEHDYSAVNHSGSAFHYVRHQVVCVGVVCVGVVCVGVVCVGEVCVVVCVGVVCVGVVCVGVMVSPSALIPQQRTSPTCV